MAIRLKRLADHILPVPTSSPLLLPALPQLDEFTSLKYEIDQANHVAICTLSRPAYGNAINTTLFLEIMSALALAARDDNVWCIVWTGEGKVFCAGADFSGEDPDAYTENDPRAAWTSFYRNGVERTLSDSSWVAALGEAFFSMEKPMIAAINGAAAGAGFAITLCCDIRLATRNAKFVPAFSAVNLPPEAGLSYLLPRVVGLSHAMDIVLTGRNVSALEAKTLGLITRLVEDKKDLMQTSLAVAAAIGQLPQPAVRVGKEAVRLGMEHSFQHALRNELMLSRRSVNNPFSESMSLKRNDDNQLARIRQKGANRKKHSK